MTFTCQVFMSFTLEWHSEPIPPVIYTAFDAPPDTIHHSPFFEANLTSVISGDVVENSNITSILRMIEPMNTVSVECQSEQDNETESFTTAGNEISMISPVPSNLLCWLCRMTSLIVEVQL